jgi:hypothetical protein
MCVKLGLILKEERRLCMFENSLLRRVFEPKGEVHRPNKRLEEMA